MLKKFISLVTLFILLFSSETWALIHVVSAENFYGSVIKQIGGQYVDVKNILDNPNQDPHLFSASPKILMMIEHANLIVYNGADYDPWILPLLTADTLRTKKVIKVSDLLTININSNPHIWYDPNTMLIFAQKIAVTLGEIDPVHQGYFVKQLNYFTKDYQPLLLYIKQIHAQFNKTPVTATEPVFNYMASSLGLQMLSIRFQEKVMNDVTPSPSDIQAFEDNLTQHKVHLLIYNKQVSSPMTNRMLAIANRENIPVVGVTETLPISLTYVQWMMEQLVLIKHALQNNLKV